MNVLVSLHRGYGLGDAVQMSSVLRHVVAARPNWVVDYRAEEGKHQVGQGIVSRVFPYTFTTNHHYDAEVQVCLYDNWVPRADRPSTHVSYALEEYFGLDWRPEFGRYQVEVSKEALIAAGALIHGATYTKNLEDREQEYRGIRHVAVHYDGDSAPTKKNLTHEQANRLCLWIEHLGYMPVILDWRGKCELPFRRLRTPSHWGADAEMVCAVIRQCEAFVGVDSGPAKCASATDVPSLVVWTGHHPAQFHDPAPNTTHLIPVGYHDLAPVRGDRGVVGWFEANYAVREYERCPLRQACKWLQEVLA